MKSLKIGAIAVAMGMLTGCATHFNGSAPGSTSDSVYVVGSYQGFFSPQTARLWRCPAQTKGKCERLKVSFED